MNYKTVFILLMVGGTGLYCTELEIYLVKKEGILFDIAFFIFLAITFAALIIMMLKFAAYERILKKKNDLSEKQKVTIRTYLDMNYLGEPDLL